MTSYLTPAELALRWRCSRYTVRRLIGLRELAAVKVGRLIRIALDEVLRYERRMSIGGAA